MNQTGNPTRASSSYLLGQWPLCPTLLTTTFASNLPVDDRTSVGALRKLVAFLASSIVLWKIPRQRCTPVLPTSPTHFGSLPDISCSARRGSPRPLCPSFISAPGARLALPIHRWTALRVSFTLLPASPPTCFTPAHLIGHQTRPILDEGAAAILKQVAYSCSLSRPK